MELCADLRQHSAALSSPRWLASLNLLALVATFVAVAYLAGFEQLGLCPDLRAGAIALGVLAVLGHVALTAAVSTSALARNAWPASSLLRGPAAAGPASSLLRGPAAAGPASSLLRGPAAAGPATAVADDDDAKEASSSLLRDAEAPPPPPPPPPMTRCRQCCTRGCGLSALALFPVALLYVLSFAFLWVRNTTVANASARLVLPGLAAGASVTRSGTGVLHVDASSLNDLYFAQGAAHASTRLWQLEFQRRVGAGTLAAAVGPGGLDADRLMRTLGVYSAAARDFALLPAAPRQALVSYAAGVNAYIGAAVTAGQRFLPIEFVALGITPAPWSPVDSLVWSKIMSWDLSGNIDRELLRYRLLVKQNLSKARIDELVPPFDTAHFPTVLSDIDLTAPYQVPQLTPPAVSAKGGFVAELLSDGVEAAIMSLFKQHQEQVKAAQGTILVQLRPGAHAVATALSLFSPSALHVRLAVSILDVVKAVGGFFRWVWSRTSPHASRGACIGTSPSKTRRNVVPGTLRSRSKRGASNNWVVRGNLSSSGFPLLANDPHLQLLAPSLWQLTHLTCAACDDHDVIGASFAGVPGVVIGRNKNIAWGVTNTGIDVQDTYIMQDAPNASSYLFDGTYVPYELRTETIKVAGHADVNMQVRVSRFGPVITDNGVFDSFDGPPLSLRWVSIDPTIQDTIFAAFVGLQTAANWSDFRAAMALWTAPSQNVIYADTTGSIGYQMPGYCPTRSANHSGAFPMPGTTGAYDWLAPVPFDALPRTFNPPEGFIVTANNRVMPADLSRDITADWDAGSDGYRARRITALIRAGAPALTAADMVAIQGDVTSGLALDFGLALANVSAALFASGAGLALRNILVAFDGSMAVGSRAATLSTDAYARMTTLAAPETGVDNWPDPVFLLRALASDARGSPDRACGLAGFPSCSAWAAATIDAVAAENGLTASSALASIPATVPAWGVDVHVLEMKHAVLGASPLACIADRLVGHGGDHSTPNVGTFYFERSAGDASQYAQDHGPSYRQVIDFSDLNGASLFVHPMGADGAPFSFAKDSSSGHEFKPESTYDDLLPLWASMRYASMSRAAVGAGGDLVMTLSPS